MTESHSIEREYHARSMLEIGAGPIAKISTRCHVTL